MQKHDIKIAVNNLNAICRACLSENSDLDLIFDIKFDTEENQGKVDLATLFKRYCSVEISSSDQKPQQICKLCVTQLTQSFYFFEKITWSNSLLDDVLKHISSQAKEEGEVDINEGREKLSPNLLDVTDRENNVAKQIKDSSSDTEDDLFVDNDNDSDWEPLKAGNNKNNDVKIECLPDYNYFKNEKTKKIESETSEEEVDSDKKQKKKRKPNNSKQVLLRKRGRPRKNVSTFSKIKSDDTENFKFQENKDFECRLCRQLLCDINTAIDHYDEYHAPQLERDECILCDKPKTYKKRDNLLYHMGLHSKDSLKCIPCRKFFRSNDLLQQHVTECLKSAENTNSVKAEVCDEENDIRQGNIKSGNGMRLPQKILKETQFDGAFNCQLCGNRQLGEIDSVIEHYEKEHINDLQCIICLRTFTKHVPLFHLGLHSEKSHVCRPCRLFFRTKEQYDDHNRKYDHDKSLACRICGKTFTRNYKKNKHMLSHLKEKNYSCNKCGKTFTYKTSLVRHFKMHFGKRFLCSACGNAYTTKFMLQRHFNIMHKNVDADGKPLPKPPPKPVHLQCEFCGEIFTTKYGYGRHIRRHPEFNQYKCKICSFMCDNRDQLDVHMEERHNKHTCEVCGKRFPFESELKTHFRKHEDMEMARYRCGTCGKAARTPTQLKVHLRIHTGERPFSCDICGKSFKQTAHLKVHMYQHTGKMPFKCCICEKSFPFQHIMEIHMRTHTGEKPFQCMFCGNAYHDRTTMQKHQKKKHPEMPLEKVSRSDYKMTKLT